MASPLSIVIPSPAPVRDLVHLTHRTVLEPEFQEEARIQLAAEIFRTVDSVTGPGRSGAIAASYASHILGVPFLSYGVPPSSSVSHLLVIDTVWSTGGHLRRAMELYAPLVRTTSYALFREPPLIKFWFEREILLGERVMVTP